MHDVSPPLAPSLPSSLPSDEHPQPYPRDPAEAFSGRGAAWAVPGGVRGEAGGQAAAGDGGSASEGEDLHRSEYQASHGEQMLRMLCYPVIRKYQV